jgi:hypothetical protein
MAGRSLSLTTAPSPAVADTADAEVSSEGCTAAPDDVPAPVATAEPLASLVARAASRASLTPNNRAGPTGDARLTKQQRRAEARKLLREAKERDPQGQVKNLYAYLAVKGAALKAERDLLETRGLQRQLDELLSKAESPRDLRALMALKRRLAILHTVNVRTRRALSVRAKPMQTSRVRRLPMLNRGPTRAHRPSCGSTRHRGSRRGSGSSPPGDSDPDEADHLEASPAIREEAGR